jgi:hypothetical protein
MTLIKACIVGEVSFLLSSQKPPPTFEEVVYTISNLQAEALG